MNNTSQFPRGIEVVTGVIIENKKGKIFLMQSPKWGNTWIIPGGHVEPGEAILDSAVRETFEETGMQTKPIKILLYRELINPPDFNRPAHLLSFICIVKTQTEDVKIDTREITKYKWIDPKEIQKENLAQGLDEVFQTYLSSIL